MFKDCKSCLYNKNGNCHHPLASPPLRDPDTGRFVSAKGSALQMRLEKYRCGKDALWYKPKSHSWQLIICEICHYASCAIWLIIGFIIMLSIFVAILGLTK